MRTLNLLFLIVQDRCIHFSILYSYLLWHFWWCNDVCLNNIQHFSQTIMDWIIKGSIENLIFKSKKLRLRRVDMRWRSSIDIDRESDNLFYWYCPTPKIHSSSFYNWPRYRPGTDGYLLLIRFWVWFNILQIEWLMQDPLYS